MSESNAPKESAARAAINESLRIYEGLRLVNGGTNDITIAVVKPLQQYTKAQFCRTKFLVFDKATDEFLAFFFDVQLAADFMRLILPRKTYCKHG